MNLKTLALLVCISQAVQIALTLFQMFSARGYFSPLTLLHVALNVPLVLFFFYVWQRQKP
jgi:hypothetical protein